MGKSVNGVGDIDDLELLHDENGDFAGVDFHNDHHSIGRLSEGTFREYQRVRNETRKRLGYEEITNEEFIELLLQVYNYHLDPHPHPGADSSSASD